MKEKYDNIIIGAGIYGLYAAWKLGRKKRKVAVLEYDNAPFQRASYINQARVHNGYHYPRSYSTATKSHDYFERFNRDFSFAINDTFKTIYAIANRYSFTSGEQFQKFCHISDIPCEEINPKSFFQDFTIDAAFETQEYAFCALKIRAFLLVELEKYGHVDIFYSVNIDRVEHNQDSYSLIMVNGDILSASFVINATYASTNQLLDRFGFEKFKIKYEICEIILCDTNDSIQNVGITVMDGPFFSVMPFGFHSHSLTSVAFTPHISSNNMLPVFPCQEYNKKCTAQQLENCNICSARPKSAWRYMEQLSKKYLNPRVKLFYKESLFAIKPILVTSELDDSRPTVIKTFSKEPTFISVLSGKINTIYDLDEVLG